MLVRNRGGRIQGTADMKKAFQTLNKRVSEVLTELHHADLQKYFVFEIITDETTLLNRLRQHIDARKTSSLTTITPMVYIMLNNPAQMRKLIHGIPGGRQRWCQVRITRNLGEGKWEVQYLDTMEREVLPEKDIRPSADRKQAVLAVGEHMTAYKSDKLRYKESVFAHLTELLGVKDMRARALFIVDEGDLAVGGPNRKANQGDRIHFHETASGAIAKTLGKRRGAREYAYGSVSITATPAALMLCSWPVQLCGLCFKDMQGGGPAKELKCKAYHRFCIDCLEDFLAQVETTDRFQCPACARYEESDNDESESDDDSDDRDDDADDDDDGYDKLLSKEDIEDITLHPDVRSLRLHIARTDRPRNYVYYTDGDYDEDAVAGDYEIRRSNTDEREDNKAVLKLEVYKQIFLGQHGDEWRLGDVNAWNQLVEQARNTGKVDLWDNYVTLRRYNVRKSGSASVQVHIPRNGSDVSRQVSDLATGIHWSLKTSRTSRTVYEIEVRGLFKMLASIHFDQTSPFRHALISSDKTTNINKQEELQKTIVSQFEYMDLAVARYESKSGVTVLFTKTALETRDNLIERAVEEGRNRYVDDHMNEVPVRGPSARERALRQIFPTEQGFRIRDPNINIMYEILKRVGCKKSVVITGHIGGRGVSYHDLEHETILTDMYTAMHWEQGREITLHGEHLIQLVGRLNTIYTSKQPVPRITLWAPPSFHKLHKAHMSQIQEFVQLVQDSQGSLQTALQSMSLYISGVGPDGKEKILRQTRGIRYAELQRKAQGDTREYSLPPGRPRPAALLPYRAPQDPDRAVCHLFAHYPTIGSDLWGPEHVWDAGKGTFSETDYIVWTVSLPDTIREISEELQQRLRCEPDFLSLQNKTNHFEVGFRTRKSVFAVRYHVTNSWFTCMHTCIRTYACTNIHT